MSKNSSFSDKFTAQWGMVTEFSMKVLDRFNKAITLRTDTAEGFMACFDHLKLYWPWVPSTQGLALTETAPMPSAEEVARPPKVKKAAA